MFRRGGIGIVLLSAIAGLALAACGGGGGSAAAVPTWRTATPIGTDNSGDADFPQVAINAAGTAVAVWIQDNGTFRTVRANRYAAGVGWGNASVIETDDGNASRPRVAINSVGNAMAVWMQDDGSPGSPFHVRANRSAAGSGWGDNAAFVETDDGDVDNPHVAMDSAGNAVAVWQQLDATGTRNDIRSNRYAPGVGWGDNVLIEADDGDAQRPWLAMNSAGDAVAVWSQFDGTQWTIRASRYAAGSGWDNATLIGSDTVDMVSPQVAIDGVGNAVAVWQRRDVSKSQYDIWANRYTAGFGWGDNVLIETDDGDAGEPRVAMDGAGNALVVWEQFDPVGTVWNIRANRYAAGVGWENAVLIEGDAGNADSPRIAMNGAGNGVAVWLQSDGTYLSVRANRYTPEAGWGNAVGIETNGGDADFPQVAMDAAGNAVAVWRQFDGTRWKVWANTFR